MWEEFKEFVLKARYDNDEPLANLYIACFGGIVIAALFLNILIACIR